jgi:hypothetical protein
VLAGELKNQTPMKKLLIKATATLVLIGTAIGLLNTPTPAAASGGSGGGGSNSSAVETIKVSKCEYAVVSGGAYVELLLNASSSNSSAHLYAYLPDGTYLGEVQNGGGGRYGGTVFGSFYVPDTITIKSSAGGVVTVACVPFQL